jgi:hypothetical protein
MISAIASTAGTRPQPDNACAAHNRALHLRRLRAADPAQTGRKDLSARPSCGPRHV